MPTILPLSVSANPRLDKHDSMQEVLPIGCGRQGNQKNAELFLYPGQITSSSGR